MGEVVVSRMGAQIVSVFAGRAPCERGELVHARAEPLRLSGSQRQDARILKRTEQEALQQVGVRR